MSDKSFDEALDKSLDKSLRAEEYEIAGRKIKRASVDVLLSVRADLTAEERVRRNGNIIDRAGNLCMRRG